MENIYLTRVVNGETQLHEVNFKATIPQEVLMGVIEITSPSRFTWEGRKFEHGMYATKGKLTHVIKCDTLFWQVPLRYDKDADKFFVHTDNSQKQYKVGIKNCILIIHTGDQVDPASNMYITQPDLHVPQVTNIYDDGRLCVNSIFTTYTDPRNIIATLEDSPGNADLLQNHETGESHDLRAEIPLEFYEGTLYAKPYNRRTLNHDESKYIKRYISN